VVSVEIDRGLFELARETIADCGNVRLLCADVLRGKNQLNPAVMAAVSEPAPERLPIQRKLVANLPYVVATPVITLLLMLDLAWDRFVVTVQKELADRLVASPGTRDYGSLSVLVQALADVELVRELPPSVFWPRPNVASAIVVIRPSAAKRAVIRDLVQFSRFVRGVLLHRRKNLRGAMSILLSEIPKAQIDGFLRGLKIDPHVRAESLTVAQFIRLADALPEHWRALPARSG
jgi:16S rRNA (adenine1518-N6/adenine1519-N6)-dimethyltransferase